MGDITFTGQTTLILILLLGVSVFAVIIYFKNYFKRKAVRNLTNKYPEINIFKYTKTLFLFGLVISLAGALVAFSWTTYEREAKIPEGAWEMPEVLEIVPPRTPPPPPLPPQPPLPIIDEVPEEKIKEEDEPKFVDRSIDEEALIEVPVEKTTPPPSLPPPPPEEPPVHWVVEQMPRFPGCEDIDGSNEEKAKCAEQKMLQYIYNKLDYPVIARENEVEGLVVLQFVVSETGAVNDVRVVRDIGAGTGDAALMVVKAMNDLPEKWTPGKQNGRPVKVQYTLPVKFKLE